jgi:CRP/FNR family transcriptional regulator, transcriptional activator FtrB
MSVGKGDLDRVRTLPLFAEAAPETFASLIAEARLVRAQEGAWLVREGAALDDLYILLAGSAELEGTWDTRETTLAIARPLFAFPLASVVIGRPPLFGVRIIDPSDLLAIPAVQVRAAMRADAGFAFQVGRELAASYRALLRTLKNQKLRGGLERLANYLITLREEQGGAATLHLPYEKRRLASLLGMTPENLSRAFATLADHGVAVKGRSVAITRPDSLSVLAKPDPLIDASDDADGGDGALQGGLYAA